MGFNSGFKGLTKFHSVTVKLATANTEVIGKSPVTVRKVQTAPPFKAVRATTHKMQNLTVDYSNQNHLDCILFICRLQYKAVALRTCEGLSSVT